MRFRMIHRGASFHLFAREVKKPRRLSNSRTSFQSRNYFRLCHLEFRQSTECSINSAGYQQNENLQRPTFHLQRNKFRAIKSLFPINLRLNL